jgi:hypothetical protein
MGIKSTSDLVINSNQGSEVGCDIQAINKMQQQAFEALDKEYEQARMNTHTHRGMGLGFASMATSLLIDPNTRQPPSSKS